MSGRRLVLCHDIAQLAVQEFDQLVQAPPPGRPVPGGSGVDLDPVVGAEQKGVRHVLIVSNEEYNQTISNVTILPLTSTQRHLYPSEVLLSNGKAGQPLESIIMAHQVRTISKKRLGKSTRLRERRFSIAHNTPTTKRGILS